MITSIRNTNVKEALKLYQRKYRERYQRFLVEGLEVIRFGLNNGRSPLSVFYCIEMFKDKLAWELLNQFKLLESDLIEVNPQVIQHLSQRDVPQGILVTFPIFDTEINNLQLEDNTKQTLLLILDRLQDPGNLGTLIRTADAVGADGVILIEPCVDLFDQKTISASAGSLFSVPLFRTSSITGLFNKLSSRLTIVGADNLANTIAWNDGVLNNSIALILGNEARGISDDIRQHVKRWVKLPIIGQAESLNVSVAGGTLLYIWLKQNLEQ